MTPLERAARAICATFGYDPDKDDEVGLGEDGDVNWNMFEDHARAVIAAIREPTHTMQAAAFAQKVSFRSGSGMSDVGQVSVEYEGEPDKGAATLWQAMIDAMLEEG
ncbi:hypothetical protein ACFSUK_28835 [Sphingobium scionense]|uniref:Uncharacterized protein n=1 Tax=Sphingobium scionense TaxID=1404341 RepID=A0A7W6LP90_9SPHN|nr:hypothetical protein [Sphingobium scionense]MBB4147984.1 hypothetical protein [Sphingobium scionense]